jgi:hypothetical protein
MEGILTGNIGVAEDRLADRCRVGGKTMEKESTYRYARRYQVALVQNKD